MTHAKHAGRIIAATIKAPAIAQCLYCGHRVELRTSPGMTGLYWGHVTEAEARECERERALDSISERKDK